jgi:fimbrial chaperone protein
MRRVKLGDVTLQGPSGEKTVLLPGLVGYVLPGSTMHWKLTSKGEPQNGVIRAKLDDDLLESDLLSDVKDH